ncbi:hypothetical protein KIW84_052279 [Lathyrus oleraceus]|uniref:Growth-regulating factor n=1 Tax=Pisum sativum TaxID=3888 RepID=A0A9D5AEX9_PEA|nr:hypothetical protein KIW84_052279 [Pisum sativum]
MQTKRRNNNNTSSFEGLSNKKMMMQYQHPNDSYGPTIYNLSFGGATTILKSQADVMAASLGNAFTSSQWRELEIQVMIYKYLLASLPVPSYLLSSMIDGGFNTRLSSSRNSSTDPEVGRCRRTDGKKWRCSRYVAPNNKYCERHMHRGSHRSRKPVELHTNDITHHQIKRTPIPTTTKYAGTSSQFLASSAFHPYLQPPFSLDNSSFAVKLAPCYVPSNTQPRGFDWTPNGDPISLGASNSGWNSLIHNNILGMTNENSYLNINTESHYLSPFPQYNSSELSQQERPFCLVYNPLQIEKPRGFSFIDTWSNANTVENNANNNNASASVAKSVAKSPLSSLDLSMGGPLAEVLRPSNVTSISDSTSSNPSSSVTTNRVESIGTSRTGTMSSPSGVFHNKTLTSFSDSSGNSSPTCIIKTQF